MDDEAEVIICAGPPTCPFEDDAAVEAADAGCPKCRRVIIHSDGSETEYQREAH